MFPISTQDEKKYYSAIKSKDHRFDGHFYMAVVTTGVFCRPICPARLPKPENVRYFLSPAAAVAAGFRPCLRCRPEKSPSATTNLRASALVERALEEISKGFLDHNGVEALAQLLGVSERHLRRVTQAEIGASPIAIAQTQRILLAKRLLDDTSLTLTDIAYSAGFSSIRRFNDAFSRTYGKPPGEVRRHRRQLTNPETQLFSIKIPLGNSFDWTSMQAYLKVRAIPGVETVTEKTWARNVKFNDQNFSIEVQLDKSGHFLIASITLNGMSYVKDILTRLQKLFDVKADVNAIKSSLVKSPILCPMLKKVDVPRVPGAWDPFELATRAIVGQRVSVPAATTFMGRIAERAALLSNNPTYPYLSLLFPTPSELLMMDLNHIGITQNQIIALRSLCSFFLDEPDYFIKAWDYKLDDVITRLTQLPGVGEWTAQYIALRVLKDPDAFPAGDLVLRKVVGCGEAVPINIIEQISEQWRPWRAYAAMVLWNYSLHQKKENTV